MKERSKTHDGVELVCLMRPDAAVRLPGTIATQYGRVDVVASELAPEGQAILIDLDEAARLGVDLRPRARGEG